MESTQLYSIAADSLLVMHFLFVLFVIFGLLLVFVGKKFQWRWVTNPWFRLFHLLAITVVVFQAWLGVSCPLTVWEMSFRAKAGDSVYSGSFIAHWVDSILYYQAPAWVFTLVYTLFGALVLLSWFWVKPRSFHKKDLAKG